MRNDGASLPLARSKPVSGRLRAAAEICRLPNVLTAAADILAGFLIVTGPAIEWRRLAPLLVAGSLLYAGGCVLNDLVDREIDGRERPSRPIPSGRITPTATGIFATVLFAAALGAAGLAGPAPAATAIVLFLAIASYDLLTKERPLLGPLNMGLCRGLNLFLGMSVALPALPARSHLLPALTIIYVFALTRLSRRETAGSAPLAGWRGSIIGGWLIVAFGILWLSAPPFRSADLLFPALFLAISGDGLRRALARPDPATVGRGVKTMVLCIPLLDAAYVAALDGPAAATPVALCAAGAYLLGRRIAMT